MAGSRLPKPICVTTEPQGDAGTLVRGRSPKAGAAQSSVLIGPRSPSRELILHNAIQTIRAMIEKRQESRKGS